MSQTKKSISLDQLRETIARRQGTYTTDQRCPDCWLVHPLYWGPNGPGCAIIVKDGVYIPLDQRINWSDDEVSRRKTKRAARPTVFYRPRYQP